jgi:hypothetical protein
VTAVSRRELLKRATAVVAGFALLRLEWLDKAFAAKPGVVQQTLNALAEFIVPGQKIEAATTRRLIRTLDRFLPGQLPLSATAATILNETAVRVKPGARSGKSASAFANLSRAEKAKVFQTLEALPVETAGSIRFLVGNLPDLTAFLAYSTPAGRRLARYAGVAHGRKELKGYWQGREAADP